MNLFEMKGPEGDLLRSMWAGVQKASQDRQLAAIKADPDKHRLTRLMAKGSSTNYRYYDGGEETVGGKLEKTKFCFAVGKNAAGVYLIWRQVDRHKRVKGRAQWRGGRGWQWYETQRYDFQWAPTRAEAKELAKLKSDKAKATQAPIAA